MDNAHKYNIKVVNLSIGTNDRKVNLPLKEAVERLWQMGIVVVAAAGNPDGRNGYRPPPAVSGGVISVGAWEDRSYRLMGKGSLWIHPADVKIQILPPVSTENLSREEIRALPEKLREMVANGVNRLKQE